MRAQRQALKSCGSLTLFPIAASQVLDFSVELISTAVGMRSQGCAGSGTLQNTHLAEPEGCPELKNLNSAPSQLFLG